MAHANSDFRLEAGTTMLYNIFEKVLHESVIVQISTTWKLSNIISQNQNKIKAFARQKSTKNR